jgi:Ribonuclease G/E
MGFLNLIGRQKKNEKDAKPAPLKKVKSPQQTIVRTATEKTTPEDLKKARNKRRNQRAKARKLVKMLNAA